MIVRPSTHLAVALDAERCGITMSEWLRTVLDAAATARTERPPIGIERTWLSYRITDAEQYARASAAADSEALDLSQWCRHVIEGVVGDGDLVRAIDAGREAAAKLLDRHRRAPPKPPVRCEECGALTSTGMHHRGCSRGGHRCGRCRERGHSVRTCTAAPPSKRGRAARGTTRT